jgi:hypothetical protein
MGKNAKLKDQWFEEVVPAQRTGQSSFTQSRIHCRNQYHAQESYQTAAKRLLNVNGWHAYAGRSTAAFQLYNIAGDAVNRTVQEKDYLSINIPGPGNPAGEGNDWVQVQQVGEKQADQRQLTFIIVKATSDPLQPTTSTTHFFDEPATSTFVVYRNGLTITAAVFGRNEHANLSNQSIFARIRNWFIFLGAQLGFANLQWKALTHGLLHANQS